MSEYIKGNEIIIKTPEQLMAFGRDCRLAALREVREMIDKRIGGSYNDAIRGHYRYFMRKIDAMIAKEER